MGSRDDHVLDDERADVLMRRLLARADEPAPVPSDLVSRSARRLPAMPPAMAARQLARRRRRRIVAMAAGLGTVVLLALIGLAGMMSGSPQLALLFGDGTQGISHVLLTLHLLAKPAVRALGMFGVPLMLASTSMLLAGGWLWWRLLPSPAYVYAENKRP